MKHCGRPQLNLDLNKSSIISKIYLQFKLPNLNGFLGFSVLSFFGLTDYVMVFDQDFRPVPIPDEFRNLRLGAIRRTVASTENGTKFWVSVSYSNPLKHPIFSKSLSHPKDIFRELMSEIGFERIKLIRLTDYSHELDLYDDCKLGQKLETDVLKIFEMNQK